MEEKTTTLILVCRAYNTYVLANQNHQQLSRSLFPLFTLFTLSLCLSVSLSVGFSNNFITHHKSENRLHDVTYEHFDNKSSKHLNHFLFNLNIVHNFKANIRYLK